MKKKVNKLELKRISIRELSPREMSGAAGAGYIRFILTPTIDMPSGCCLPPPPEEI